MISFKGAQFPKDFILHAMFFYLRYAVSYRDLEEILAESIGVQIWRPKTESFHRKQ